MKRFKEEFKPIEIEVEDINGTVRELKSTMMTIPKIRRINTVLDDTSIDTCGKICNQMSIIFGGEPKTYEDFSLTMLSEVLQYYNEQMKLSPTSASG